MAQTVCPRMTDCMCVHMRIKRKLLFPCCVPHPSPSPQLCHHRPLRKPLTWLAG